MINIVLEVWSLRNSINFRYLLYSFLKFGHKLFENILLFFNIFLRWYILPCILIEKVFTMYLSPFLPAFCYFFNSLRSLHFQSLNLIVLEWICETILNKNDSLKENLDIQLFMYLFRTFVNIICLFPVELWFKYTFEALIYVEFEVF